MRENDVNIECWGKRGKKDNWHYQRVFEEVERLKSFNKSKYLVLKMRRVGGFLQCK